MVRRRPPSRSLPLLACGLSILVAFYQLAIAIALVPPPIGLPIASCSAAFSGLRLSPRYAAGSEQSRESRFEPPEDIEKYGGPNPIAKKGQKPNGISLETIKKGKMDSILPGRGSNVLIHHTGWRVEDGQMFDSSYLRGDAPEKFSLRKVIPGWTNGIVAMREGEIKRLWIPAAQAYGSKYPSGDLVYEIELVKIEDDLPWGLLIPPALIVLLGELYLKLKESGNSGQIELAAKSVKEQVDAWIA